MTSITADAVALQERDEFRSAGWLKLIAPAKVNLHLAVGARRPDGYHELVTVLHAVNLHDVVYLRDRADGQGGGNAAGEVADDMPSVCMVACADVALPDVAPADNLAVKAVRALAEELGRAASLDIRIEKNIPVQAGLGGGSADAAAALVGAARLWGVSADDPVIERVAASLGSDVAFFLRGGCALFEGAGERFVRALAPSNRSIVLVKPAFGISTAAAYAAFDASPTVVPEAVAHRVRHAAGACDVALFNNLAPASEQIAGELADIRAWLGSLEGAEGVLLCGSGAATFVVCADFQAACRIVAQARRRGLWARSTSLGSARALAIGENPDHGDPARSALPSKPHPTAKEAPVD